MSITPNVNEEQVKTASKYPWAVALLFFGALIGFFVPKFTESKDQTIGEMKERVEKMAQTINFYRQKDAFKDSLLRVERERSLQETQQLKRDNDSLQKLLFDTNTKGLERVISIIENGKSAVVIKPKKK